MNRLARADERAHTADLISLRVIHQELQGCAGVCKTRISTGVSFLRVAARCTVLRSRWYQNGINRGIAASRSCSVVAFIRRTSGTSELDQNPASPRPLLSLDAFGGPRHRQHHGHKALG
jgi:hypothetical protein